MRTLLVPPENNPNSTPLPLILIPPHAILSFSTVTLAPHFQFLKTLWIYKNNTPPQATPLT